MIRDCTINGREAAFPVELRVGGDEVVRPADHGADITARAVVTGAQFYVVEPVVVSPAISMVDSFRSGKFAAKSLFHDQTMLKDFAALDAILIGKPDSDVALSRDVTLNLALIGRPQSFVLGELESGPAFGTANGVSATNSARRPAALFSPFNRDRLAADDAWVSAQLAAPFTTASTRAVHRVVAEGLSVLGKLARLTKERRAAVLAGEFYARHDAVPPMLGLVGMVTRGAAILFGGVHLSRHMENRAAVPARQIGWGKSHRDFLFVKSQFEQYHNVAIGANIFALGAA